MWKNILTRACSRSIWSKALQVKQGGLKWVEVGNEAKQLPQTDPSPQFFNLEQYKEKTTSRPRFPKARMGAQPGRHRTENGYSREPRFLLPKSELPPLYGSVESQDLWGASTIKSS